MTGHSSADVMVTTKAVTTSSTTTFLELLSYSAGIQVCNKIHKRYGELMKHHEFKEEVCVMSNEEANKIQKLPTWTLISGPRRSRKMNYDDDPNEAPDFYLF